MGPRCLRLRSVGPNLYGTPPQSRADYAFWQHIQCSLSAKVGRCAILFPHGVLFRQEEAEMRRKLIEADAIECVLGLGPNLFYNSPMKACVVVCRTAKPKARKGRILFINAVNEVTRERAQSVLAADISPASSMRIGSSMMSPASPEKALHGCLKSLDGCHVYLLIVGADYGTLVGQVSITDAEYRHAKEKKLPVLAFIKGDRKTIREAGTEQFLAELEADSPK